MNGCVQFYDTSTNNPTKWRWTFGDDLFYEVHQNPVHQYINPGVYSVQLTVTNADGTDNETRTNYIQVIRVNHPPVLAQIPNQTAIVGTTLTFTITAMDPDNDILQYSAVGLPGGATFNPGTRTFAWTPNESSAGNSTVIFSVSDGEFTKNETGKLPRPSQNSHSPCSTIHRQCYAGPESLDGAVHRPIRFPGYDQHTPGTSTMTGLWITRQKIPGIRIRRPAPTR